MLESWPHAPPHRFAPRGTYILTAGTYRKHHLFNTPGKLDLVRETTFDLCQAFALELQAWAILANHYHLVLSFEHAPEGLNASGFLKYLHREIATRVNENDGTRGRRVMYQHWDTELTYERSWLARLHYVNHNLVHHGLVPVARDYPWCSAQWFESNAKLAFVNSVYSFKLDRVRVPDDF